ncbi:MAG: hypothetical protein U0575_09790 [Phycisphaerales bacterium]
MNIGGDRSSNAPEAAGDRVAPPPTLDPALRPDALAAADRGGTDALAAAQFVHGLLEHLRRDDQPRQARRLDAVMRSIGAHEQSLRLAPPARRWLVAAITMLSAIVGAAILADLPARNEAFAAVRDSIAATQTAGDRSYLVLAVPDDPSFGPIPPAQLDIRDADHQVFTAIAPTGDRFIVGRNIGGSWAIRPDGSVDRFPPKHAWPRWIDFGESAFLADSSDDVLSSLPAGFTLRPGTAAVAPGTEGPICDRVTALRRDTRGPEPTRVELWIDRSSRLVRRMELHWPPRDGDPRLGAGGDRPGPGGRNGPREFGGPRRGEGGRDWHGEAPNNRDDPAERRDARRRGDRFDDGGPPGPPPPRPPGDRFDDGGPPGPQRRDEPCPPTGFGAPPPPAPRDEPRRRGPPPRGFLDAPPEFRAPGHPPPPRMIVFELRATPIFDDSWFEPSSHVAPSGE